MRNYLRRLVQFLSSLSLPLVLSGPALPGCGGQVVHPAVNLVDRTTAALSLGSFMEINGSFGAGCTSRSGAWSVGINGFAALTNPALSVLQGDSGCILDVASARIGTPATNSLYAPTDQITMWSAYNQIGRAFMMREWLDQEVDDICGELGINANHCGVLLYRARMALRECLAQNWFEAGAAK